MLLQSASSCNGSPRNIASPRPNPSPKPSSSPKYNASPSLSNRFSASPSNSDGASSTNSPRLRVRRDSSNTKTSQDDLALEKVQAELRDGWTVHSGRDGRLYYCNHVTRTASWLPPAECWSPSSPQDGDSLPYGWEQALDARGKPYYINHVNKTTTYVAPEGCSVESPPSPRDVVLERHPELGFGFVAGSEKPVLVRFVTDNSPSVGKLEPGDQILCVNGEDVSLAAREHVIAAVRACNDQVTLRVCQPVRVSSCARRSALLTAAKRARLKAKPPKVRFADSVQLNGAPLYPPSAFSLGDLCLPPMANVLKVFLENGQTKSFKYDTTTTVADVVTSLKDKLCISAAEHFSLVVEHVKGLRRNKLTLLDPDESLARIASRPGAHKMRCLYRVVFMPSSAAELAEKDSSALDYLFLQCCNDVAQERFAPELQPDVAIRLAALQVYQHALANNVPPSKLNVKTIESEFGLERFVPSSLLENMKRKELRRLIAHFLKINSQVTGGQKQLTQLQAKLQYLDIVSALPSYGAKCFSSSRPERVLLISPRYGLSQIVGVRSSLPQAISSLEEVESIRVRRTSDSSADVAIFLSRDRVLALAMDDRDATEMPLVIAGYYRLATGRDLNIELEREPITEDIAPPYLSQHNVSPSKWSYLHHDLPEVLSKKHFAIFSVPPPYHTPSETPKSDSLSKNSNNSSPLIGYDSNAGLLGCDIQYEICKGGNEINLFDPNDCCYIDDGMGFDLQSVLSMEMLENIQGQKVVEAKNNEVLKRVAEMQELVENSEQYLTEHGDVYNDIFSNDFLGKETSVDQCESDTESINSRMSATDDAPGILKHSDSLLLLTEAINQEINVVDEKFNKPGINRKSQGLSAILNNSGLNDALLALNNDLSMSESDTDSICTPSNSPNKKNQKSLNKVLKTSFGLHSPDFNQKKESNLKEYLKQLKDKSKEDTKTVPCVEVSPFYQEETFEADADIIDLTLIPPPQTPDELDSVSQVPQILPEVPPSFADDKQKSKTDPSIEEFIANVTIQPPTVRVTPAIELTPEEIMSYIIPPPPGSNFSTLDRKNVTYANQTELNGKKISNDVKEKKIKNGEIMKGTLSVSEIRNLFAAKTLSDARNSLMLKEKKGQGNKADSPKFKGRVDKHSNGNIAQVIEYPTIEKRGFFSCCSKDEKESFDEEEDKTLLDKTDIPDVCEIRPPPRRKNSDTTKPPERPPKTGQLPPKPVQVQTRPRTSSFSCPNNDLATIEINFGTLNNRKINYNTVCDMNAPKLPPRIEKVLSPPPPLLLPPKKPPLPIPGAEVLRMKNLQKSPLRNEQKLASIGSPHFQRNLNSYRNLEIDNKLEETPVNGNVHSMTLQSRHIRSHSESKPISRNDKSTILSICSPQMNRKTKPDILNGAPVHTLSPSFDRRSFRRGSSSPTKVNHVRFKEETIDDIPTPPSPPTLKFPDFEGRVSVENLLSKTDVAVDGLLQRLNQVAQKCSHQHAHGGGENIDEVKFQRARTELSSSAVSLVTASRSLVGALGGNPSNSAQVAHALHECLAPLRRLADLSQALGRHTSSPLQTRNLVLRVHDVTAAFKELAGEEMAHIIREHNKKNTKETSLTLEGQIALRAECLANVLATLLRSLRVFSP